MEEGTSIQAITLVECRPYGARITPRACALRKLKAQEIKKKGTVSYSDGQKVPAEYGTYLEIEKCLKCPGHGAVDLNICRNGDGRLVKKDGLCEWCWCKAEAERRANDMSTTDKEGKAVTSKKRKAKPSVCSGCGRSNEEAGRLYKKLCEDCRKKRRLQSPPPETEKKKPAGAPPEPSKPDLEPERGSSHGPAEEISKPIYTDGSGALLFLDFTGHADLLEALTEAGKKEFRTPSGQAMAILEKTLKGTKP